LTKVEKAAGSTVRIGPAGVFWEGLTPEEVLRRLGARRESVFPLSRH
jgi:hypothetical protein